MDRETLDAWHKDPRNWKLGILYYNRQDRRIFPPKRFGIGWTVNFGNPNPILALGAIILVAGL
jgi:uncharacterized membrane protein